MAIGFGVLIGLLLAISGAVEMTAYCSRKRGGKPPKERLPEVGTIRIVEKMDKDGSVYYVADIYVHRIVWRDGYNHFVRRWEELAFRGFAKKFGTVEEAQAAANAEMDRRRAEKDAQAEKERKENYMKVMGEFKP